MIDIPQSPRWKLDSADWQKAKRAFLYAFVGALITAIVQVLGRMDFGDWQPFVSALISFLVYIGNRLRIDNTK